MRPTTAIIDKKKLEFNLSRIQQQAKDHKMMAIVKANAYGHGLEGMYKLLKEKGIHSFGVATISEALELREMDPNIQILVIGACTPYDYDLAVDNEIELSLHQPEYLKNALQMKQSPVFHLHVDTGMHRIGFSYDELKEHLNDLKKLSIKGVFTHMARADEEDTKTQDMQRERFFKALDLLEEHRIQVQDIHSANSATLMQGDLQRTNMVRIGIMLYGMNPSEDVYDQELQPILSIWARVVALRVIEPGEGVSYGYRFIAKQKTKVATLAIGYADGYPRGLSNQARVFYKGKYLPVIGNVTMDHIMIDATDTSIALGDKVELIGEHIRVDELAKITNTINYELVTGLSRRIHRVYE